MAGAPHQCFVRNDDISVQDAAPDGDLNGKAGQPAQLIVQTSRLSVRPYRIVGEETHFSRGKACSDGRLARQDPLDRARDVQKDMQSVRDDRVVAYPVRADGEPQIESCEPNGWVVRTDAPVSIPDLPVGDRNRQDPHPGRPGDSF